MPGPVYRDSLRRCDPPSMLYDTVRNPNAPYIPPKPAPLDTLESPQKRLNREVAERFKNVGLRLPHDSYVAVVQVGKFLFLAIMLPTYIGFYGIPRWILLSVLPQLFHFVKNETFKMGRFIKELAKSVADLMKGMRQKVISSVLRVVVKAPKVLLRPLAKVLKRGQQTLANSFQKLKGLVADAYKNAMAATFGKLIHKWQSASAHIQQKSREALQRFNKVISHISKAFTQTLSAIDQAAIVPFMNWLFPPFLSLTAALKRIQKGIKERSQKTGRGIQSKALRASVAVQAAFNWALEHSKRALKSFGGPILTWVQEKRAAAGRTAKKLGRKLGEPMAAAAGAIAKRFKALNGLIRPKIQQALNWIPAVGRQLMARVGRFFAPLARWSGKRKSAKPFLWKSMFKRAGSSFAKNVKNFIDIRKRKPWMHELAIFLASLLFKCFVWMFKAVATLPRRTVRLLAFLWRGFKSGARQTFQGLRLAVAWGLFGFRHGMGLVRELTDELALFFSFVR